jgi:hypothetical protein
MIAPDHPALILSITAAIVYLWLTVINPFVFAAAPSPVATPVAMTIDQRPPATPDIEPAPLWE